MPSASVAADCRCWKCEGLLVADGEFKCPRCATKVSATLGQKEIFCQQCSPWMLLAKNDKALCTRSNCKSNDKRTQTPMITKRETGDNMNQVYIGRPELPVYIDPGLNMGNLPEAIAKEARRVAAQESYNRGHILNAEAVMYLGCQEIKLSGPDAYTIFRLKFHYCCKNSHFDGWNEEYRITQRKGIYSIVHMPRVEKFSLPCH